MKSVNAKLPKLLAYILTFQALVCITTILDISYARQVLGFIFFLFVPGFLLLKIFKAKNFSSTEILLYSVGLSITFLMLIGFLLNELGTLNLVKEPLSTVSLFIAMNSAILLLSVFSLLRNKDYSGIDIKRINLRIVIPCILLPLLSIIGILFINYFGNNLLSIFVIILISITAVIGLFYSKISSYYPLILFAIVIALLLSTVLASNYLYGDDIQGEFYTFTATHKLSYWNPQDNHYYQQTSDNSMLSITILPTIISNLLNIEGNWVFKIIFPLIFSLVPLGLYELYSRHWNEKVAFISVFFFVANYVYFEVIITNAKQMIAELFFVLSFLILFRKDWSNPIEKWLVLIFSFFGLVVSHYSMNYIFIFLILFAWLGRHLLKNKITALKTEVVAFSACITWLWYLFQAQGPFDKFAGVVQTAISNFAAEFFSSASRGEDIQAAIGIAARPSLLHYIGTYFYDLTALIILIGFVSLLLKWRKGKFDSDFFLVIFLSLILLISAFVIPRFAGFLELGRLYHVLLMLLSPLFVLGVEAFYKTTSNLLHKRNKIFEPKKNRHFGYLLLALLIPFFLFQTGVLYGVSNDPAPSSISLSKNKLEYSDWVIHESDVFSAVWLSKNGEIVNRWTFADSVSFGHVLASYSKLDLSMIILLSNTTNEIIVYGTYVFHNNTFVISSNTTYIYLAEFNTVEQKVRWDPRLNSYFDYEEVPVLNSTTAFVNRIYSNSYSEIYFRAPH